MVDGGVARGLLAHRGDSNIFSLAHNLLALLTVFTTDNGFPNRCTSYSFFFTRRDIRPWPRTMYMACSAWGFINQFTAVCARIEALRSLYL